MTGVADQTDYVLLHTAIAGRYLGKLAAGCMWLLMNRASQVADRRKEKERADRAPEQNP